MRAPAAALLAAVAALALAAPAIAGEAGQTGVTGGDTVTGHTGATGPDGGGDGGDGTTDVLGPGDGADETSGPVGTSDRDGRSCLFTTGCCRVVGVTGATGVTGPSGTSEIVCVIAGGALPDGDDDKGGDGAGLLPFTGFGLLVLAALAAGLIAGGLEARRRADQVS